MYPYVVPHTAKIHTLITLGISIRTKPHSRNLRKTPPPDSMYRNCDARELSMSSTKSRTIPPLRVSEALRADAESVLAPGETLSAFVMDAVSRTIDFRKSQLDFLARGIASAERARAKGDYVQAEKVIAGLRKRLSGGGGPRARALQR